MEEVIKVIKIIIKTTDHFGKLLLSQASEKARQKILEFAEKPSDSPIDKDQ